MSGPHLSLALASELWKEILHAALPFHLADGEVSLAKTARTALSQLAVTDRVTGLLEDKRAPQQLARLGRGAIQAWRDRREDILVRMDQLVRVQGTWSVEIDDLGTDLTYGPQRVAADAYVKGVAEGEITILSEGITVPFRIEQRLGASVALSRIRFSAAEDAVIGNVSDLAIHLGDHAVWQILSRLLERVLATRVHQVPPVKILRRAQVESLVGGLGGAMKVQMGVESMHLAIDDDDMQLQVRFGFSRLAQTAQLGVDD